MREGLKRALGPTCGKCPAMIKELKNEKARYMCGIEIKDGDTGFCIEVSPGDECHLREILQIAELQRRDDE